MQRSVKYSHIESDIVIYSKVSFYLRIEYKQQVIIGGLYLNVQNPNEKER